MPRRSAEFRNLEAVVGARVAAEERRRAFAPGERMCGFRLVGGLYAVFTNFEDREDLTRYLMRPEIRVDARALGLAPVGVTLIERNGVTHIVDWIGEEHYATPEVFMDEVDRMGLSRRLPRNLDCSALSEDSRVLCVHRFGWYGREGPAIFASFPISALEVVRDADDRGEHVATWEALQSAAPRNISTRLVSS